MTKQYQSPGKSCVLKRNYSRNPALQPVKGIIIFHPKTELGAKALALLKSLSCEVIASHNNRFTVRTSRGNLHAIKQRWLDHESESAMSLELNTCVAQIIIGGAIN